MPATLLTVAYDGTDFHGFAPQPGLRTVYDVLLTAAGKIDPAVQELRGASRTDAGVHARGQRVAFDGKLPIPPRGWALALNTRLPADVAVRAAQSVPDAFEPRAHSEGKRYRYLVLRDSLRDPQWERFALRVGDRLDVQRAREEASAALGTHDFAAYRSVADARTNTVRTLHRIELVEGVGGDERLLAIEVEGSGFLHNMVRIIAGTLLDVGRGFLAPGAMARALQSRNRRDLGFTAPAHGLCLEEARIDLDGSEASPPWP